MFDIGWGELVVIGIVALIAIGPKELPGVLRSMGHWMGKIRRMASEFQGQFNEAMREAEMTDIKKSVDELNATASSMTNFDPLAEAKQQVDDAFNIKTDNPPPDAASAAPAPSAPAVTETSAVVEMPAPAQEPAPVMTAAPQASFTPQASSTLLPDTDAYVPLQEPAPAGQTPPKKAGGAQPA